MAVIYSHMVVGALAFAFIFTSGASSQAPKTFKHHAAFQMSEPEAQWGPLLAHVANLLVALAKDGGVDVEVVF